MRWLDKLSWTSSEAEDLIVITVVRERGALGPIIGIAALCFFILQGYLQKNWLWLLVVIVVGLGSLISEQLRSKTTRLTVTERELIARGNIARSFGDQIRVDAKEIRSLSYFIGGENEPSGLYAMRKHAQTCLIPGLNEQQSAEIALLIYKRFPDLEIGDTDSSSLLYGKSADLTSLNLSGRKD